MHLELHTHDLPGASAFYDGLLRWRTERIDVRAIAAMLTESATLAMPPTPSWFRGRDAVLAGLRAVPFSGGPHWRLTATRASGQLAAMAYLWDRAACSFVPRHIAVLTLRGAFIDEINAFIDPSAPAPWEPAGGG